MRFLAGEACSSDKLERMARSLSDLVSKDNGSDFDMQEALDDHVVQGVAAQLVRATQKLCYGAVSKNESSALDAVKKELVDKVTTLEQLGKTLQNHIEQDSESALGETDETKKMLKNTPVREWGTDEVSTTYKRTLSFFSRTLCPAVRRLKLNCKNACAPHAILFSASQDYSERGQIDSITGRRLVVHSRGAPRAVLYRRPVSSPQNGRPVSDRP